MELEERVEQILSRYQNKFNLLLEDMRTDLLELVGLDEVAVEEITVGEARKVAILRDCASHQDSLKRQMLSEISNKYGKPAGSLGVYYRPDVNLLETKGNFGRKVTPKGLSLVKDYNERYGDNWVEGIRETLSDNRISDSTKIKIKLKKGNHLSLLNLGDDNYDKGTGNL